MGRVPGHGMAWHIGTLFVELEVAVAGCGYCFQNGLTCVLLPPASRCAAVWRPAARHSYTRGASGSLGPSVLD